MDDIKVSSQFTLLYTLLMSFTRRVTPSIGNGICVKKHGEWEYIEVTKPSMAVGRWDLWLRSPCIMGITTPMALTAQRPLSLALTTSEKHDQGEYTYEVRKVWPTLIYDDLSTQHVISTLQACLVFEEGWASSALTRLLCGWRASLSTYFRMYSRWQ